MRYAIYFAPPAGTLFHQLGSGWLGRDAITGGACAQPDVPGIAPLTADPRRYGFHATLKAPFALRDEAAAEALVEACASLAAGMPGFAVRLKVGLLDSFLALVPDGEAPSLAALAGTCVRALDGFRRPPADAELARRRAAPLTPRQDANLMQWGYPYVGEDFRFHMTLTERLDPADADRFRTAAEAHFAPVLGMGVPVGGITLFREASPGAPFLAIRHFPFSTPTDEAAT